MLHGFVSQEIDSEVKCNFTFDLSTFHTVYIYIYTHRYTNTFMIMS